MRDGGDDPGGTAGADEAGANAGATQADGSARYVFRVRFRLDPRPPGVSVEPATFETVLSRAANPPGTDGWLFFRDNLWRGELADESHFRELSGEALSVPVTAVSFRELVTDEAYLDDLKAAVAADLGLFNAETVSEVLSKYLGSSIRVE